MYRYLMLLPLVALLSCGGGEKKSSAEGADVTEAPPAPGKDWKSFIPKGYSVLDTSTGDLNKDDIMDMILIVRQDGEDTTSDVVDHPGLRPLFVLLGVGDGTYTQAARNDKTVYCYDCGGMMGDPYQHVTIKNGYFSVEHYGGSADRWSRIITYKYSPEEKYWFLHRDGSDHFNVNDDEAEATTTGRTKKDFGKVRFDDFDIYKEEN